MPRAYHLVPTPRLQIVNGNICAGHLVADEIVKTEPITDAQAGYAGISKDAIIATVKTHFHYVDWATTPQLRAMIDKGFSPECAKQPNPFGSPRPL